MNYLGENCYVIRADGHGVPEILDAILQAFPLDTYCDKPVSLMQVVPGDPVETPIWDEYKAIVAKYDKRGAECFENIERFAFYEDAKKAYCIIATYEKKLSDIGSARGIYKDSHSLSRRQST